MPSVLESRSDTPHGHPSVSQSPQLGAPSTIQNLSIIYGECLSVDQEVPIHLESQGVSQAAHPLAQLHADRGPVAAPAAQEAAALAVAAGGIGTQLAPAPACRHKAKGALLQLSFTANTESYNHRMAWKGP